MYKYTYIFGVPLLHPPRRLVRVERRRLLRHVYQRLARVDASMHHRRAPRLDRVPCGAGRVCRHVARGAHHLPYMQWKSIHICVCVCVCVRVFMVALSALSGCGEPCEARASAQAGAPRARVGLGVGASLTPSPCGL